MSFQHSVPGKSWEKPYVLWTLFTWIETDYQKNCDYILYIWENEIAIMSSAPLPPSLPPPRPCFVMPKSWWCLLETRSVSVISCMALLISAHAGIWRNPHCSWWFCNSSSPCEASSTLNAVHHNLFKEQSYPEFVVMWDPTESTENASKCRNQQCHAGSNRHTSDFKWTAQQVRFVCLFLV